MAALIQQFMHKGILKTAFLLGAFSVAMGAFAAHGLKDMVSDHALSTFETAVRYQFYHVFALAIVGILYKEYPNQFTRFSGWFFIAGIVLFSGSLYVLAMIQAAVQPGYRWVGIITPFGGLCFILGWLMLAVSVWRRK